MYGYFPVGEYLQSTPLGGTDMAMIRTTVYIDSDTNTALRDYARIHRISIGEANNQLLRRALFNSLDEGTEAMLAPEIRKAVQEAARREIREHVTRLLGAQTDRLFGVLATSGRDTYVARKLTRERGTAALLQTAYGRSRE